jgi:predicted SprT family Zn-dependent metalloprotease
MLWSKDIFINFIVTIKQKSTKKIKTSKPGTKMHYYCNCMIFYKRRRKTERKEGSDRGRKLE